MKTLVDKSSWARREIYDFFSGISNPFYVVTFRQQVSKLYRYAKQNGLPFYYAMIWLCTKAINTVDAFKYTIDEDKIYKLDRREPSFTDLRKDSECFHIVRASADVPLDVFCREAREKSEKQLGFINMSDEGDDLIYFSCLPWVDITAVTNERDLALPASRDEAIPHITWGKFITRCGEMELGISLEVNHRLIDGIHIGRFAEELTRLIDKLEED